MAASAKLKGTIASANLSALLSMPAFTFSLSSTKLMICERRVPSPMPVGRMPISPLSTTVPAKTAPPVVR